MIIKNIKIGKPKELKPPKDKFIIHVETMHGDADLSKVDKFELKDIQEAIEYWNIISVFFDIGLDKRNRDDDELMNAIEDRGKKLGVEYAMDIYNESVSFDATSGYSYLARVQAMWLTYFDEKGIEYEVYEPKQLGSRWTHD